MLRGIDFSKHLVWERELKREEATRNEACTKRNGVLRGQDVFKRMVLEFELERKDVI